MRPVGCVMAAWRQPRNVLLDTNSYYFPIFLIYARKPNFSPPIIFFVMKYTLSPLLLLPFLVLACDRSTPTTADLEAQLCSNLDQFGTSLTELGQINAQSSVNDLQTARTNVAQAYQAVRDASTAVEASRTADLEAAYTNFDNTVNSISGGDTLGAAATQVQTALAEIQTAREQLDAGLNCP